MFLSVLSDSIRLGRGGVSIYGDRFPDELDERLKHTGAGTVVIFDLRRSFVCNVFRRGYLANC